MSRAMIGGRLRKGSAAWRCAKACIIIGIACALIPLSGSLASFLSGFQTFSELFSQNSEELSDSYSVSDEFAASQEAADGFSGEVIYLDGLSDLRANEDCSVVGFSMDGSASETLAWLERSMEQKGWTAVESGSDSMETFVKSSGEYTWAFANCVELGDETSVVLCAR